MDSDCVRVTLNDDENWEQKIARLKALESVNRTHHQAESKCRVYSLLRTATKEGNLDNFIETLEKYAAEGRISLFDIIHEEGPCGNSLLHVAAGIKNPNILRALLEVIHEERLATKANYQGDTALHFAARAGLNDTAQLLLAYGNIVDMANHAGNTALHEAVKNNHKGLTQLLLEQGSRSVNRENRESKCPLYLAVETGNLEILVLLMQKVDGVEVRRPRMQGLSPVHGAVVHRRGQMLQEMLAQKKELFDLRDAKDGTPLHLAAYMGYEAEVEFLVKHIACSAIEHNRVGYLPIHVACQMGHHKIVKKLLEQSPDPEEWLTSFEWQNVLHVAAMYGKASVVKYILGNPELEKLINAKDKQGYTPLHVATSQWQTEVLFTLTRDKRVDRELVNHNNLTALDIVYTKLDKIDAPLRQRLTRIILVSAKAPRSKDTAICLRKDLGTARNLKPPNLESLMGQANTRMLVTTLVAAMTFAAGFSVPGGYNGSEPDAGIATLLNKPMYDVFVICNTIAMYSSTIATVILLWTQINDSNAVHHALRGTRLPLLIALATMPMAFMAGVYVTISKSTWIAIVALIIGITALFVILVLYIALFIPLGYTSHLPFSECIIKAGISISKSVTEGRAIRRDYHGEPERLLPAYSVEPRDSNYHGAPYYPFPYDATNQEVCNMQ